MGAIVTIKLMASVKYGSIITEIKGSLGGHFFSRGNTCKSISTIKQPPRIVSAFNQIPKQNLGYVSGLWKSLSPTDQASWIALAEDVEFYDKFGNAYHGSGYQCFCSFALNLISIGLPPLTTAYGTVGDIAISNVTYEWRGNDEDCTISFDTTAIDDTWYVLMFSSMFVSLGQNTTPKNMVTIDKFQLLTGSFVREWGTAYYNHFSVHPGGAIGKRTMIRLKPINTVSGQQSTVFNLWLNSPLS